MEVAPERSVYFLPLAAVIGCRVSWGWELSFRSESFLWSRAIHKEEFSYEQSAVSIPSSWGINVSLDLMRNDDQIKRWRNFWVFGDSSYYT